jgi:hypothetical protein
MHAYFLVVLLLDDIVYIVDARHPDAEREWDYDLTPLGRLEKSPKKPRRKTGPSSIWRTSGR